MLYLAILVLGLILGFALGIAWANRRHKRGTIHIGKPIK